MNRTKAREYAFILLFEYKFQPDEIAQILKDFIAERNPKEQTEYIESVVLGVANNIEKIDKVIADASIEWELSRISTVSISVLRLAVFEMLYMKDIPPIVSLNEAITIGKLYDGEDCAPFLNGVLSKIMHTIREDKNE